MKAGPPIALPPLDWPPLIGSDRASRWIRLRDFVLTSLIWFLLLWMLQNSLAALTHVVSPDAAMRIFAWLGANPRPWRIGVIDPATAPPWDEYLPFLQLAALFVLGILLSALWNRKALRHRARVRRPVAAPPLGDAEHCADAGVPPAMLALWREARALDIVFDAQGRIVDAVEPRR